MFNFKGHWNLINDLLFFLKVVLIKSFFYGKRIIWDLFQLYHSKVNICCLQRSSHIHRFSVGLLWSVCSYRKCNAWCSVISLNSLHLWVEWASLQCWSKQRTAFGRTSKCRTCFLLRPASSRSGFCFAPALSLPLLLSLMVLCALVRFSHSVLFGNCSDSFRNNFNLPTLVFPRSFLSKSGHF